MFDSKKIAVTGGAGMIGSEVCEALVSQNCRVVVVDDFSRGDRSNLSKINDHVEIREGNLEEMKFVNESLHDCDYVLHLASRSYGIGYSDGRHLEILEHNEQITANLMQCFRRRRPDYVLLVSSSCVYDDHGPEEIPELPVMIGEPEAANWGYGWSKRFLESRMSLLSKELGVRVGVVRPFNIYSERYRWAGEYSQAIPMLVKKILDNDGEIEIWGSGNQRRSYLHASDCAHAIVEIAKLEHHGSPINIGTNDTVSLMELAKTICRLSGKTPVLRVNPRMPEGRSVKSSNMSQLLKTLPDFSPKIGLEEGLLRMLRWYERTCPS
tara:strand:+ start:41784 stop:42755 length:972 start_codon:yes stop_codon:yes gene_type:complete